MAHGYRTTLGPAQAQPGPAVLADSRTVAQSVAEWARTDGRLAALLDAGVPPGEALARWGVQLINAQQFADAATALRAATTLAPDDPPLWTSLGLALERDGSLGEAAACFERSVSLHRDQPNTWLMLGLIRKRQGDRSGCEADYRVALGLAPRSAVVWQCLGLLKEEQREYSAAIECFEACARCGAQDEYAQGAVSANLGKLYCQVGRIAEAHDAYAAAASAEPANVHYGQMLRRARFLRDVLGGESVDGALATYARPGSGDAVGTEEDLERLLESACGELGGFGQIDAAIRLARRRLEVRPDSATARYILSALCGERGLDRSPPEFIVESFDAFAEHFEAKLVGVLGYDVPEKLGSAICSATPAGRLYDTLDAGCGTGLCAPLLRPLSRELTGVDLSPKMLEQAGRRAVYDRLVCAELTAFLRDSPGRFDLVVAADVVIYFGDMAALFTRVAGALRPDGLFAFSAEHLAGEGYRLQPTGRFAHAPNYIRSLAGSAFAEELCAETTLRLEGAPTPSRVRGNLFLFRRR